MRDKVYLLGMFYSKNLECSRILLSVFQTVPHNILANRSMRV